MRFDAWVERKDTEGKRSRGRRKKRQEKRPRSKRARKSGGTALTPAHRLSGACLRTSDALRDEQPQKLKWLARRDSWKVGAGRTTLLRPADEGVRDRGCPRLTPPDLLPITFDPSALAVACRALRVVRASESHWKRFCVVTAAPPSPPDPATAN